MKVSYTRLAVYGVILLAALWFVMTGRGDDGKGLAQPGDGIPYILFVTSQGALKLSTSGTPSETIIDPVDLRDIFAENDVSGRQRPVVIVAHQDAPGAAQVQAMDSARRAGAPSVTLVVAALN